VTVLHYHPDERSPRMAEKAKPEKPAPSSVDNSESVKYPGSSEDDLRAILLSEMPIYKLIQDAKARNNK